jgi:hypothetical protein
MVTDELPDAFVINVPHDSIAEIDTDSLGKPLQAPKLRGPDLVSAISITADLTGAASALVSIAVARQDLAEMCRRLVRWARKESPAPKTQLHIEFENQRTSLTLDSNEPDKELLEGIIQLVLDEDPH